MGAIAFQITSLTIVYSTLYWGSDQSKHQSSASLAFVWGIRREPVNSPHKWPVTRKMFPFDYVIMFVYCLSTSLSPAVNNTEVGRVDLLIMVSQGLFGITFSTNGQPKWHGWYLFDLLVKSIVYKFSGLHSNYIITVKYWQICTCLFIY